MGGLETRVGALRSVDVVLGLVLALQAGLLIDRVMMTIEGLGGGVGVGVGVGTGGGVGVGVDRVRLVPIGVVEGVPEVETNIAAQGEAGEATVGVLDEVLIEIDIKMTSPLVSISHVCNVYLA